jgi:hypothetical protein
MILMENRIAILGVILKLNFLRAGTHGKGGHVMKELKVRLLEEYGGHEK